MSYEPIQACADWERKRFSLYLVGDTRHVRVWEHTICPVFAGGSHAAFFFTPSWEASCWPTYNGPYQSRRLRHAAHGQHAIKDLRRAIREILWRNPLERGLPGEGEPVRHFADVAAATGARLA